MAKKDWKKVGENKWKNLKTLDSVEIGKWNNSYIVVNQYGFNSKGVIGVVNSKSKAIKKARAYMRRN